MESKTRGTMRSHFICDVDGCLVPPRGERWDLTSFAVLADRIYNKEVPFTLCSGRPATFMEAISRQLTITSHLICENGTMLFNPQTKVGTPHPNIQPEFLRDRPLIQQTLQNLLQGRPAMIELGKDVMFSINSHDPSVFADLMEDVKLAMQSAPVQVVFSGRSIEVLPLGVTKAQGLELWMELEGVDHQQTFAIGDADNDLEVLNAAYRAGAPSNCTENVRRVVEYVSDQPMVQGILDIISWVQRQEA